MNYQWSILLWYHPSISIASLSLEEKGKLVENQKKRQLSWSERWTSCCQQSCLPDLICCHLSVQRSALWPLQTEGCRWKNIPTGREEEKRGFEKIDGQLSKRERKLRARANLAEISRPLESAMERKTERAVVGEHSCHIHKLESTYEETHTWIQ